MAAFQHFQVLSLALTLSVGICTACRGEQSIAWDGRGARPTVSSESPKQIVRNHGVRDKGRRRATESNVSDSVPLKPYSPEWFARRKAQDDAEERRLKNKMSICRRC
jgi:hypothetical protein